MTTMMSRTKQVLLHMVSAHHALVEWARKMRPRVRSLASCREAIMGYIAHGVRPRPIPDDEGVVPTRPRYRQTRTSREEYLRQRHLERLKSQPNRPECRVSDPEVMSLYETVRRRGLISVLVRESATGVSSTPVIVRGDAPARIIGHHGYFRWRGAWKSSPGSYIHSTRRVCVGHLTLTRFLSAPGRINHPSCLQYECGREERVGGRTVVRRWVWTGREWTASGVAVRMPAPLRHVYGEWEHGSTVEECESEIRSKREALARQSAEDRASARASRAAGLLARIAVRITASYEDAREYGYCRAGIESWCSSRGIDPSSRVPLAVLYRDQDRRARALAVAVARKALASRHSTTPTQHHAA